jgi:autotransporter adhesin
MAIAGLSQATTPGKSMITGGVGTWRDQSAVAFGASHRFDNSVTLKLGGSVATKGGGGGMNASVGYEF